MKLLLRVLLLSCFCHSAFCEVQVAFLELVSYSGKPVIMEAKGRFAHVAIAYRGNWLHAHPLRGVEMITLKNLQKIGRVTALVTLPEMSTLEDAAVSEVMGRPYDAGYSWSDERLYCSELIAKLLGISPTPMVFSPLYWPLQYQKLNGRPGVSPDGLYRALGAGVRN